MFPRVRKHRATCLCGLRQLFRSHFPCCHPQFPEGEYSAYSVTAKQAPLKVVIDVCRVPSACPSSLGAMSSHRDNRLVDSGHQAHNSSRFQLPVGVVISGRVYPAKSLLSASRPPRELRSASAVYSIRCRGGIPITQLRNMQGPPLVNFVATNTRTSWLWRKLR